MYVWGLILVLVVCGGCGRKQAERQAERSPGPQTATESAEAKAPVNDTVPFLITTQPPPLSAPRVLVMWSDDLYGRDLWVANIETGEAFQITRTGDCLDAWWSPDRKRIAYVRRVDEGGPERLPYGAYGATGTVWVADAQTGRSQQLSDLQEVRELAWSHDGQVLAASGGYRPDDAPSLIRGGIWLISLPEGKAQLIYHGYPGNGDIGDPGQVQWVSESLLRMSAGGRFPGDPESLGEPLPLMNRRGEFIAVLNNVIPCVWDVHGENCYFGQQNEVEQPFDSWPPGDGLHYLDVSLYPPKSQRIAFAGMTVYGLALSADGKRLACWVWDHKQKSFSLWEIETATKKARRLMAMEKWPDVLAVSMYPRCGAVWSPADNRTLACYAAPSYEHGKECGMWLLDTATEKPRRLLEIKDFALDTATEKPRRLPEIKDFAGDMEWSDDGRLLAYVTIVGPQENTETERFIYALWILDTATEKPRRLLESKDFAGDMEWSDDGRLLAYTTLIGSEAYPGGGERKIYGLWVMNTQTGDSHQVMQVHDTRYFGWPCGPFTRWAM